MAIQDGATRRARTRLYLTLAGFALAVNASAEAQHWGRGERPVSAASVFFLVLAPGYVVRFRPFLTV
jgi:hypothetical protein